MVAQFGGAYLEHTGNSSCSAVESGHTTRLLLLLLLLCCCCWKVSKIRPGRRTSLILYTVYACGKRRQPSRTFLQIAQKKPAEKQRAATVGNQDNARDERTNWGGVISESRLIKRQGEYNYKGEKKQQINTKIWQAENNHRMYTGAYE
jgi:hypothetical protein